MKSVQHINVLGKRAKDPVSEFSGVIKSLSFDLHGCIQALVQPPVKDSTYPDSVWFDIKALDISDRVVDLPNFDYNYEDKTGAVPDGLKGAVSKPSK